MWNQKKKKKIRLMSHEVVVPIDRSKMWKGAIGRIKWVIDALGPIAEVHIIPS